MTNQSDEELRDRLAGVIHDALPEWDKKYVIDARVEPKFHNRPDLKKHLYVYRIADAVIKDLRLKRQEKTYGCLGVNDTEVTVHRYITDWRVEGRADA
ncbi:MAG: hypothetical protein ACKODT_07965 [Fluviibacter sp.]